MDNHNYWAAPFKILTARIDVKTTTVLPSQIYPLEKLLDELKESDKDVVGVFHRAPATNSITKDGKPLVVDNIFQATHCEFRDVEDRLIVDAPLRVLQWRDGAENAMLRMAEGMGALDFDRKKSKLILKASSSNINTSAGNTEQWELIFVLRDKNYCKPVQ